MDEHKFIINQPVHVEETRYYEFKEVKGNKPLDAIKNTCDEYVVAFLNSAGGRIFWGVRDSDRYAVGVPLTFQERDELRRTVTAKLNQIQPPISPTAYQINLYPIYEDESCGKMLEDRYILEVVAPRVYNDDLYSTGGGEVFVKTDSGKRKLNFQEVQDEIRRRQIQKDLAPFIIQEVNTTVSSPSFVVQMRFANDGSISQDELELHAMLAEALHAADNKQQVDFDLDCEPLEVLRNAIVSLNTENSTPQNRLHKVKLLNLVKTYDNKLAWLRETMPLLFQKPVRDMFLTAEEITSGLQNMAFQLLSDNSRVSYANDRHGIDVFRRDDPRLNAVIWIDKDETEQIISELELKSIFLLRGDFGYDFFDLPRQIQVRKAIPAMSLEATRISIRTDNSFNIQDVLKLDSWYIGLH